MTGPGPGRRAGGWAWLVLGLGLGLAGCGAVGTSRLGVLTVWTSHNNEEIEVFRDLVDRFSKDFATRKGRPLRVELARVAHEGLDTKLKSACLSGTTPDLCRVDVALVATLAWGSAVVRLDDLPGSPFGDPARLEARFVAAALDSNRVALPAARGGFESGLFGIPEQTNCLVLFRNRALFRAAADRLRAVGLDPEAAPKDLEEMERAAVAVADPAAGIAGLGYKNILWWTLPWLFAGKGELLLPDPVSGYRSGLSVPASLAALGRWASWTRTGRSSAPPVEGGLWRSGANMDRSFLEGKLAMVLSGPWNVPAFKRRVPEVAASLVPAGPGGTASTVGGNNLVVMRTCKDREAALALLDYVGSDPYQEEWSRRLGQIPVTREALARRATEADAILRVFMEQMSSARARPPLPSYEPVELAFQAEMELALQGRRTVPEAVARFEAVLEREVLGPLRRAAGG